MTERNKLNTGIKNGGVEFLKTIWSKNKLLVVGMVLSIVLFGIPSFVYISASKPANNIGKVAIVDEKSKKKLEEENKNRLEVETRDSEEISKKQVESEKNKLEDKIVTATKINSDYDVESSLESQDKDQVIQVNRAIATFGSTTQNQKLFDILSVVDGDTIKVSGLGTLRLIGMDTPETKDPRKPVQCFGKEASNRGTELMAGKKVYLEFDPSNRIDKYNRTLAYVFREDGYFYNLEMVKDGYANSYTKYPHPKLDEFNKAQSEARKNKKGFWSENTCGGDTTKPANISKSNFSSSKSSSISNLQSSSSSKSLDAIATGINYDKTGDGKVTCADFSIKVRDPNVLAMYPNLDGDKDGVGCESN